MPFRSHIGRGFDFKAAPTLTMFAIVVATGAVAGVLWLTGGSGALIFYAPAYAFVTWALLREIDPDHQWTALIGAAGAGAWVVLGGDYISLLPVAALLVSARLVTESTGRRPLFTDLAALGLASLIGFSEAGWVAGFGLAVALYLDDRLSYESRGIQVAASAVIAVGTTLVASLTDAFPEVLPDVVPYLAIGSGALALLLVIRDPADPITQVDARHKSFLRRDRLHVSRSLIAILVVAMVLLLGQDAFGLVPLLFALTLALVSNEVEIVRRRAG
jgi:hypothetical protein